ncbi:MAG: hypothetical protein VXW91_03475 [Pseudomonadota bacterium]|nr:hypothetical protein [Pseudomonadota bacterium]MEC8664922.1 hypothetical protein [Pseudomonadota bacterium]
MALLEDLPPEHRGLIVGLLYRAGVWMSHSDDEGGEDDDVKEMKALEHVIRSVARINENSDFVQEVAKRTLFFKDKWPTWADHSFDILADCEKAMAVLKPLVPKQDLIDYRNTVIYVAEAVAAAHGEFGVEAEEGVLNSFLGKVVDRFKGGSAPENDFMNISPSEQAALDRLKKAMPLPRD